MKLRKQQKRLDRRLNSYADTLKRLGSSKVADGFHKPGSAKKPAPAGRGKR